MGRTTLRRILVNARLKSPRLRSPPKHRVGRQCTLWEGILVHLDGSYRPWLRNLVSPFTWLIAVDDATGVYGRRPPH